MKLSEERILNTRLQLSEHAIAITKLIEGVKESDPVMAGALYREIDQYIKANTKVENVFSIQELIDWGYIKQ